MLNLDYRNLVAAMMKAQVLSVWRASSADLQLAKIVHETELGRCFIRGGMMSDVILMKRRDNHHMP